ncbi:uncharacterized protein LOC135389550 [Ornithodoros turicata]|uniref:uncharacterized protein LOC135389550 n=1 Tax=Ornithodoros turicata TaxID=34597 RepID=UPI0031398464
MGYELSRHTLTPIGKFDLPDIRFDHVHLNIVGSLPLSPGYRYLLTAVDRYTRWPEATPMTDMSAETLLGTTRLRTTSYHPASNGLVERLHRHLKTALIAHEDRDNWVDHLPQMRLGIRAALKPDLGCSSAELVYGSTLRLPADFFVPPQHPPTPAEYLQRLQRFFASLRPDPTRTDSSRKAHVPQELATATHVFLRTDAVRRALTPPNSGPHTILSRGEKTFRISNRGKPETVSADRIKPAFVESPAIAACSAPEDVSAAPPRAPTPTSPSPTLLKMNSTA